MAIIISRKDGDEAMRFKHAVRKMQEGLGTISDLADQMVDEYGARYDSRTMSHHGDYSPYDMYGRSGGGNNGGVYGQRQGMDWRGPYYPM